MRPIEHSDLDSLVDLDSDPEVMRYLTGGRPSTRQFYETALPRMMAYNDCNYGFVAAIGGPNRANDNDREFLGWFHLRPSVVEPDILELGYRLKRKFWGVGLATEGSVALLEHAFHTLRHDRVDACKA